MIDYTHDIKLEQDDDGIYDIHITEDGDFEADDSFDINIIMSLFVDARADASEIAEPLQRRGFWGDLILFAQEDLVSGSKLWLVYGRNTEKQLNNAIDYTKKALQWLIIENHVRNINVTGSITMNGIIVNVEFIVEDNSVSEFSFKLWENGQVEVVESL